MDCETVRDLVASLPVCDHIDCSGCDTPAMTGQGESYACDLHTLEGYSELPYAKELRILLMDLAEPAEWKRLKEAERDLEALQVTIISIRAALKISVSADVAEAVGKVIERRERLRDLMGQIRLAMHLASQDHEALIGAVRSMIKENVSLQGEVTRLRAGPADSDVRVHYDPNASVWVGKHVPTGVMIQDATPEEARETTWSAVLTRTEVQRDDAITRATAAERALATEIATKRNR